MDFASHVAAQSPSNRPRPELLANRFPTDVEKILVLRAADFRVDGVPQTKNWRRRLILLGVIALPPALALLPIYRPPDNRPFFRGYFEWQLYFAILDGVAIALPIVLVWTLQRNLSYIDSAMTPGGLRYYRRWAENNLRYPRQVILAVVTTGIVLAALAEIQSRHPDQNLYVSPISYVSVGLTAILVSNSLFVIYLGLTFTHQLSRRGSLRLLWLAPARTPGIESLSRLTRFAAYLCAVAAAMFLFPLLTAVKSIESGGHAHTVALAIRVVALVVAGSATAALAIVPQIALSQAVIRERQAVLSWLSACAANPGSDLSTINSCIKTVGDSPQTSVNDRTLIAVIIASAAAVSPGLVQIALGR